MRTPASFFLSARMLAIVAIGSVPLLLLISTYEPVVRSRSQAPLLAPKSPATSSRSTSSLDLRDDLNVLGDGGRGPSFNRGTELNRVALQTLARTSPDAAVDWVLRQPTDERLADAAAVLIALSERPHDLICSGKRFCEEDSAHVREHGNSLLAVLEGAGEFHLAVAFASEGGPERGEWLSRAFGSWAELAPKEAAEAALKFEGDDAVAVVFATWAEKNRAAAQNLATATSDSNAAQRLTLLNLVTSRNGG